LLKGSHLSDAKFESTAPSFWATSKSAVVVIPLGRIALANESCQLGALNGELRHVPSCLA